jgi:hypothetical protein
MTQHPVEKLWRECDLPEYFLGNGGSNDKLFCESVDNADEGY